MGNIVAVTGHHRLPKTIQNTTNKVYLIKQSLLKSMQVEREQLLCNRKQQTFKRPLLPINSNINSPPVLWCPPFSMNSPMTFKPDYVFLHVAGTLLIPLPVHFIFCLLSFDTVRPPSEMPINLIMVCAVFMHLLSYDSQSWDWNI